MPGMFQKEDEEEGDQNFQVRSRSKLFQDEEDEAVVDQAEINQAAVKK